MMHPLACAFKRRSGPLLDAAAAGASVDDLAAIAVRAIETWRQSQPDPDEPDDRFEDTGGLK